MYSPAFSAIFELILSHNARIAPSNKFKNSSKMQVQNCGTYSFNITKNNSANGVGKSLSWLLSRNRRNEPLERA